MTAAPSIPNAETAAALETLAREKAWRDLHAQVLASLLVWQIDPTVRAHCEPVLTWLRRLADDLAAMGGRR